MKTDTEEKEYLNNLIPIKEYESVIKNLAIKKIHQEDITIISIYAPNIGAPQYVRQILASMKEEIKIVTQ